MICGVDHETLVCGGYEGDEEVEKDYVHEVDLHSENNPHQDVHIWTLVPEFGLTLLHRGRSDISDAVSDGDQDRFRVFGERWVVSGFIVDSHNPINNNKKVDPNHQEYHKTKCV